ncbi:Gfo/Idh/MocA family protein [Anaerobium acetethylicum]|uniref:Predicted dehydrogenase n=1 Tax=Anaerobium acetethylicum TaxID=1619234 RepID=A0A1D3TWC5_9FIRM|nr:Gfo/Idh/MocA family oxidoreductase [Anaerobium acetethylicum]SCP98529.1 Predicted dehydrogenase [Anaerobium acetethylicum]
MKDNKTIYKVGLIGCGWIAEDKHIPGLIANKDVEITALCDLDVEKAKKLAGLFGLEKAQVYSDYKKLLTEADTDIILIATPNPLHCEMTVAALGAGNHVLCEKPMATTKAECEEMIAAAKASDRKLTVGYQWRYRPEALYIKEMCEKGELGEIYYAKAHAARYRAVPKWGEYLSGKNGGGVLIDGAPHALDLTLWTMNNYEPASVKAHTYHKMAQKPEGNIWGGWAEDEFKVEDSGFAIITMKNGATVYLEAAWLINMLSGDMKTTLCGTEAGVDMFNDGGVRINGIAHGKPYVSEPDMSIPGAPFAIRPVAPMYRETQEFIKAIRDDEEPFIKPEEAMVVTQIIEGIYESARSGKEVFFE